MNIQERIRGIVQSFSSKKGVEIAADDPLFDSGILDSFALVDMVAALELEFKVKIPDADLNPRKFSTLTRIQTYLEALQ